MAVPQDKAADRFARAVPETFDAPEKLPSSAAEAQAWQDANRGFWEANPMRYDWKDPVGHEEGTREFYQEIDRRFFNNVHPYLPWRKVPFDNLIDFDALRDKRVLEIGVGMGSHAGLLAAHAGSYTGIDLTQKAVDVTRRRLEVLGLPGTITRMDAEQLDFPDASFDLVWSWGVIHHSSDTRRILEGIRRVLAPGGEAVVMVYNRGWWNYYVCGALAGLRGARLFGKAPLARTIQEDTDGAIARYYSRRSWRRFASPWLRVDQVAVHGAKTDLFPIPGGRVKDALMSATPDALARGLTHGAGMGGFLVSRMSRGDTDAS
jgi:ubiquinone/menaquinone biosynthesis C-methylase UbiE